MKKINSFGQSFSQGWNDSLAFPDERPGMQTVFTCDYWIDTTEITQKQYSDITGKDPVSEKGQSGIGNQYPVCFVTWYDAVLFCNARSRADGLDTVYRYTTRYRAPDGRVCELGDLVCDISKNGYRLPTEAEWEFAARGASSSLPFCTSSDLVYAQKVAWFGANSYGTAQQVATKAPNVLGLYDLAGNVFEWVNDWKGVYNGGTVTNSLGVFQPNPHRARISVSVAREGQYLMAIISMTGFQPCSILTMTALDYMMILPAMNHKRISQLKCIFSGNRTVNLMRFLSGIRRFTAA
jgi:formylglycine-generating enzyme required for sulfatase activity